MNLISDKERLLEYVKKSEWAKNNSIFKETANCNSYYQKSVDDSYNIMEYDINNIKDVGNILIELEKMRPEVYTEELQNILKVIIMKNKIVKQNETIDEKNNVPSMYRYNF